MKALTRCSGGELRDGGRLTNECRCSALDRKSARLIRSAGTGKVCHYVPALVKEIRRDTSARGR
jgi:hypothetical protein